MDDFLIRHLASPETNLQPIAIKPGSSPKPNARRSPFLLWESNRIDAGADFMIRDAAQPTSRDTAPIGDIELPLLTCECANPGAKPVTESRASFKASMSSPVCESYMSNVSRTQRALIASERKRSTAEKRKVVPAYPVG